MFAGMLFGIALVMTLFPDIPASRAMHRAFIEVPLEKLAVMDRRHVIFGAVAVFMMFSCAELIMILGSSDLVMLIAWDMALYVDAVIATWTLAAVTRAKGAWAFLKACLAAPSRTALRPRASRRKTIGTRSASNDSDEDDPRWVYALAA